MFIETERLIIRDFEINDSDDLYEILGDSETMKYLEPAYDHAKTNVFLRDFCIARHGAAAAVEKLSDKVIGYILFNKIGDDAYEIGWIFNRSFWRKGYAFESCRAVISHAFTELGASKIIAETIDGVKSVGLMEKLGMRFECVQTEQVRSCDGEMCELLLYSISNCG